MKTTAECFMNHCRRCTGLLLVSLGLLVVSACTPDRTVEEKSSGPLEVYTTFYPTTYFTERIAGDAVEVVCPLPADADPIHWMPPAETIAAYQQANLIVVNGAGFEKWVAKVSLPESKVVDTAGPLADELLEFEGELTHSHGSAGQHSHEGTDGHTWLDPANAKVQADEIRKALLKRLPEHGKAIEAGYAALAGDLDALAAALEEFSDTLGDRPLLASHPAYNYLAKRYDWKLTSLDLDPHAMPGEAARAGIRDLLESNEADIILWESPPNEEIASRLREEFGLTSVHFSPCEVLPDAVAEGSDYFQVMHENIARLRAAILPDSKKPGTRHTDESDH